MATVTRMPQRHSWQQPCTCGCSHPPGTPCPPPECRPCPPDPSWMLWGQQLLYWNQQVQQLKNLVKEIVEEIGGPIHTGPIQGVTDGSDAAPGMVGEWVSLTQTMSYPAGGGTQVYSMGVLQPGDWDMQAFCNPETDVSTLQFYLNPIPAGVEGGNLPGWFDGGGGDVQNVLVTSPICRGNFSVPTLLPMTLVLSATAATQVELTINARRMR